MSSFMLAQRSRHAHRNPHPRPKHQQDTKPNAFQPSLARPKGPQGGFILSSDAEGEIAPEVLLLAGAIMTVGSATSSVSDRFAAT